MSDTSGGNCAENAITLTMASMIDALQQRLSFTSSPITGVDSDDNEIGTISNLNRAYMSDRSSWYSTALHYWDDTEPTIDGMLGGFAQLTTPDLNASTRFLQQLQKYHRPNLRWDVSCECGAGIGRVTKGLFLPLNFARCDLVEVSPELICHAPEYIGDPQSSKCKFYCTGLQDFEPKRNTYSVVWVQWCIGYLTDMDCIKFLRRMGESLKEHGVVILKDNTCTEQAFVLDKEDSSVTRSLDYLLALAELAGLRVVWKRWQGENVEKCGDIAEGEGDGEGGDEEEFPVDIFPVPMIAFEYVKDGVDSIGDGHKSKER